MKTKEASEYLSARGLKISAKSLRRFRGRGPDDPGDHGPDFNRDPNGYCDYTTEFLDAYRERRLGAQQFRAPLPQPAQFRMETAQRARGARRPRP